MQRNKGAKHVWGFLTSRAVAERWSKQEIRRRSCTFETLGDGCLGSEIEEGRSEMRNALRIAEFRESIDFLTRIAVPG